MVWGTPHIMVSLQYQDHPALYQTVEHSIFFEGNKEIAQMVCKKYIQVKYLIYNILFYQVFIIHVYKKIPNTKFKHIFLFLKV